jgi:NADH:ubiquinone oxidoreductase subunit 6 (subunit J)
VSPTNPFAPPRQVDLDLAAEPTPLPIAQPRSWAASLAIWSLVCIISAAPSFAWGFWTIATHQIMAMLVGIGIFIAIYTCVDQLTQASRWRRHRPVSLTLKVGYATRILISLIFPIGASIDVICGLFSIGIVQTVVPSLIRNMKDGSDFGENATFLGALLVTLIQGSILNLVLFAYMLLVLAVVVMSQRWWQRD